MRDRRVGLWRVGASVCVGAGLSLACTVAPGITATASAQGLTIQPATGQVEPTEPLSEAQIQAIERGPLPASDADVAAKASANAAAHNGLGGAPGLVEYASILVIAAGDIPDLTVSTQVRPIRPPDQVNCRPIVSTLQVFDPETSDLIGETDRTNQTFAEFELASEIPELTTYDNPFFIVKVMHELYCPATIAYNLENMIVASHAINSAGVSSGQPDLSERLLVGPLNGGSPVYVSTIVHRPTCHLAADHWDAKIIVTDEDNHIIEDFFPTRGTNRIKSKIPGHFSVFTTTIDSKSEFITIDLPATCASYGVAGEGQPIGMPVAIYEFGTD